MHLSAVLVRLLMNSESLPVAHCCPCLSVAAALRPSLCSGAEGRLLHEHFGLAQHGFAQSFGIVHVSGVIPVRPVACKKNKKSALWLALYRLLWCLITLVATRSSFLHFCSMIVAGPAHHGLVMRLRTACCGFCKHSLLRCYSWCMLFGSVSELIVVQCLGCGTDLPLVATPSSSLDRFVFGHRCSMGTLAIHCSGLCKHSCLLQMVHALWKRLRAHRCTVPWVWHGLTFGGDSELCLGQVCLWSRLLNGHPGPFGSLSNRIWVTSLVFVALPGTVLCARRNDAQASVAASRVVTGTSCMQGPAEPGRGTGTRVFFLPLFRSSSRRASTSNPEHCTSPKRRPAPCGGARVRCVQMVEAGPEEDTTCATGRESRMPKRYYGIARIHIASSRS